MNLTVGTTAKSLNVSKRKPFISVLFSEQESFVPASVFVLTLSDSIVTYYFGLFSSLILILLGRNGSYIAQQRHVLIERHKIHAWLSQNCTTGFSKNIPCVIP